MAAENSTVQDVAYHRNGISGEPFYACSLTDPDAGQLVATVFLPEGAHDAGGYMLPPSEWPLHAPRVAVLGVAELPNVAFGVNSYRGDNYAPRLYEEIYAKTMKRPAEVGS